jgi:hypothetical protein
VVRGAIDAIGPGPVFLTVDVDVLDPAFISGTGTPEPAGMTAAELLLAVRTVARAAARIVGTGRYADSACTAWSMSSAVELANVGGGRGPAVGSAR